MKTRLLALILLLPAALVAQLTPDTVSVGASYSQQTWYSLSTGATHSAPKAEWDIAFELSAFGFGIRINEPIGVRLWEYPEPDTIGWDGLDTFALDAWRELFNSDTSWSLGAFNTVADPSNQFDLGWGLYNVINHQIIGNRLFVIKLADGSFHKIWIKNLISGAYTFTHATLEGAEEHVEVLPKSSYPGKALVYYSVGRKQVLDREPAQSNWDLQFTQYLTYLPEPYIVTGVLHGPGVQASAVYPVDDVLEFTDHAAGTFKRDINTIGYDWKTFDLATFSWAIQDSLVYFVKPRDGSIWKVVFTGFGGSSSGDFRFLKELVQLPTSTKETELPAAFLSLYPNPASSDLYCLMDSGSAGKAAYAILDLSGKIVRYGEWNLPGGFTHQQVSVTDLNAGMYILRVQQGQKITQSKFIKQ